jgi:hypothetical protein
MMLRSAAAEGPAGLVAAGGALVGGAPSAAELRPAVGDEPAGRTAAGGVGRPVPTLPARPPL